MRGPFGAFWLTNNAVTRDPRSVRRSPERRTFGRRGVLRRRCLRGRRHRTRRRSITPKSSSLRRARGRRRRHRLLVACTCRPDRRPEDGEAVRRWSRRRGGLALARAIVELARASTCRSPRSSGPVARCACARSASFTRARCRARRRRVASIWTRPRRRQVRPPESSYELGRWREGLSGAFDRLRRTGLGDDLEIEDPRAKRVDLIAPDDREARNAGLPRRVATSRSACRAGHAGAEPRPR